MQEIIAALNKSFDSDKLFILSMQNYRNNRVSKEDRLTSELSNKFDDDFTIYQYKIQNQENQEYIDVVKLNNASISLKLNDVEWGLEAKTFSPHQASNNQKLFFRNSIRGLKADWEKLKKYKFKKNYLLLYLFEITDLEGDFSILNGHYPILSTYLGKNEVECKKNIENVKNNKLIEFLLKNLVDEEPELHKIFKDIISFERKIGDNSNYLKVKIHTVIFAF